MNKKTLHGSHPDIVLRLKRAEGHLRSTIGMIETGRSCVELAQQLRAIEKAIANEKKALIARQRGWTKGQTARAALQAGTGHVITTLILAAIVWLAGVAVAAKFGHWVDTISSVALVAFGLWIAISSWRELSTGDGHGHSHGPHGHTHNFSHLSGTDTAE